METNNSQKFYISSRIKGNKAHFASVLRSLMKKHHLENKDLVTPILKIKKNLEDVQEFANGLSKISNWRVGKTLPSVFELNILVHFFDDKFNETLDNFSWLYPEKKGFYIKRFLTDFYESFLAHQESVVGSEPAFYTILGKKIKSEELFFIFGDINSIFESDFQYQKSYLGFEAEGYGYRIFAQDFFTNYFKERVLEDNQNFVYKWNEINEQNESYAPDCRKDLYSIIREELKNVSLSYGSGVIEPINWELSALYKPIFNLSPAHNNDLKNDLFDNSFEHSLEAERLQRKIDKATEEFLNKLSELNKERTSRFID